MFEATAAFKDLTVRHSAATVGSAMRRLLPLAALAVLLPVASACGGASSAPAEPLPAPRPMPRPGVAASATAAPVIREEPCRTNFFADAPRGRRQLPAARRMTSEADAVLVRAEAEPAGAAARQERVVDAMELLINALGRDPYAPEPTYKLAVAYALVGYKACSLSLLERLKALTGMPEVEEEAGRAVQRAVRDPAFEAWRGDARRVLGE
jgi:hypothetical protein